MAMTPNRGYPLPAAANKLKDDVLKLIAALGLIDADIAALLLALNDKSNVGHGHGMAAITGLVDALASKIDVGHHDALGDLADVDVTGVANGMALLRQASKWIPVALQINNISGLEAALNGKLTSADYETLASALALRLRVDAVQEFSEGQKGRARANIGADVMAPFRNKLRNGDHALATRGTSMVIAAGSFDYTLDGWLVVNQTDRPVTISRTPFTPGHGQTPGNTEYALAAFFSVAPTSGDLLFTQRIEGAETLAGSLASARAYLIGPGTETQALAVDMVRSFGTGGAPSSSDGASPLSLDIPFILNAVTRERKALFNVPSVAGKSFGTNGDDFLQLRWKLSPRAAGTYTIARCSLVEGDARAEADPFAPRHPQQEAAICRRYVRKAAFRGIITATAASQLVHVSYDVSDMRAVPAVSATATADTSSNIGAITSDAVAHGDVKFVRAFASSVAAGTAAFSAERLLSAEL